MQAGSARAQVQALDATSVQPPETKILKYCDAPQITSHCWAPCPKLPFPVPPGMPLRFHNYKLKAWNSTKTRAATVLAGFCSDPAWSGTYTLTGRYPWLTDFFLTALLSYNKYTKICACLMHYFDNFGHMHISVILSPHSKWQIYLLSQKDSLYPLISVCVIRIFSMQPTLLTNF